MGLIKIKKRAFSSATNEVRRSRKRVLIASAMRNTIEGFSMPYLTKINIKLTLIQHAI